MHVIRPPDEQSRNENVCITGAASGIGLAIARLALEAGAQVALMDRDAEALERAGGLLREHGEQFVLVPCDVRQEEQVREGFARARDAHGPPTGVVACAGIDLGGPLHELEAGTWDAVMAVNLRGTFLTCREALRQMLGNGSGAIVCVSSPFALVGAPGGTGAYSASKGGVSALVRTLAVDYGQHGIRVNAVLPGPTETDLMWASVPQEEINSVHATVCSEVPLGRLADPAEPARAALWLLSDAASYVTGAQLACDGGVLAKASVSV